MRRAGEKWGAGAGPGGRQVRREGRQLCAEPPGEFPLPAVLRAGSGRAGNSPACLGASPPRAGGAGGETLPPKNPPRQHSHRLLPCACSGAAGPACRAVGAVRQRRAVRPWPCREPPEVTAGCGPGLQGGQASSPGAVPSPRWPCSGGKCHPRCLRALCRVPGGSRELWPPRAVLAGVVNWGLGCPGASQPRGAAPPGLRELTPLPAQVRLGKLGWVNGVPAGPVLGVCLLGSEFVPEMALSAPPEPAL